MDYDALRSEAVALRQQGFSLAQIGRRLGLKSGTIHRWVAHVPFEGFNSESLSEQLAARRDPDRYRRAIELRATGYSYAQVEAELGVARSTLHHWFRNEAEHSTEVHRRRMLSRSKAAATIITRNAAQRSANYAIARQELRSILGGALEHRDLFMAGLTMYWAEGTKSHARVSVTNSDPDIARLFVSWAERFLGTTRGQFRAFIFAYPDTNIDAAEAFWAGEVNIPSSQFYPAQIDRRVGKSRDKRGKLPYGTLHLNICGPGGAELHRRIMAWIDEYRLLIF